MWGTFDWKSRLDLGRIEEIRVLVPPGMLPFPPGSEEGQADLRQRIVDLQADLLEAGIRYASKMAIPRGSGRRRKRTNSHIVTPSRADHHLAALRDNLRRQHRVREAAAASRELQNRLNRSRR